MQRKVLATVVFGAVIGVTIGVGLYTFVYAKGASYLSNNPAACANCHVMQADYDGWLHSSHRAAATCNDCHTPDNLIAKYATKTSNGFFHSLAFTSGRFPDSIQIKPRNTRVTEANCRRCHEDIVTGITAVHKDSASVTCTRCHESVGHSETVAWSPNTGFLARQR